MRRMTLFTLLGGRAVLLALFGVSFWQYAIPLIASGLGALFAKKKKQTNTATSAAMDALINKQTQQMDQESPLRKLLLSQSAGLLPSYMKQDPNYAQWMENSAPSAQAAMTAAARKPYDV